MNECKLDINALKNVLIGLLLLALASGIAAALSLPNKANASALSAVAAGILTVALLVAGLISKRIRDFLECVNKRGRSGCNFNFNVPNSLIGLIMAAISSFVYAAGGILSWWPTDFFKAVYSIGSGIALIAAALAALAATVSAANAYASCQSGSGKPNDLPQPGGGGAGQPVPYP